MQRWSLLIIELIIELIREVQPYFMLVSHSDKKNKKPVKIKKWRFDSSFNTN
jgi:hypothetical protein